MAANLMPLLDDAPGDLWVLLEGNRTREEGALQIGVGEDPHDSPHSHSRAILIHRLHRQITYVIWDRRCHFTEKVISPVSHWMGVLRALLVIHNKLNTDTSITRP